MAHIVDGDSNQTRDRSVRLENDTWDRLNRLAQITELPVSWHIRRAVRNYLALLDAAPPFEADIARWMADPEFARGFVLAASEIEKAPGSAFEVSLVKTDAGPGQMDANGAFGFSSPAPKPTPKAKPARRFRGLSKP